MKKISLVCLVFIVCSFNAMIKRSLDTEDTPAAKKALKPEQLQSKETPQEVKELIEEFHKITIERQQFPNEIGAEILKNLAKVKVRGATEEQKLYKVIENIRAFMEAFPQFYGDVKVNGALIEELAKRYTGNRLVVAAIALATTGAGQWLVAFVGDNNYRLELLTFELVRAAEFDRLGTIRFLLTYFPQIINRGDIRGYTALMEAAKFGRLEIVERLLQVPGITVNVVNKSGHTPLILAAGNGYKQVVERLLKVPGIIVNGRSEEGWSALGSAQRSKSPNKEEIIKLLLAHGATE